MTGRPSARGSVHVSLACRVGAALLLGGGVSACSESIDRPTAVVEVGRPGGYWFNSLAELTVTSDVVVEGTVLTAEKGHLIGSPDSDFYVRDVVVSVTTQYYGDPVGDTVTVDQEGYISGVPTEFAEQPWVYPGDHVLYFLKEVSGRPPGHYVVVAMGGQLIRSEHGYALTPAEDPVAKAVNNLAWSQLQDRLNRAVAVAQSGRVAPETPGP